MNKKQLLKKAKEFDETLNQFDNEHLDMDDKFLTGNNLKLAQSIDIVYSALRKLRRQLEQCDT